MITIKSTDTQTSRFSNRAIAGLLLNFVLIGATNNIAISGTAVDMTKITLKIHVKRASGTIEEVFTEELRYHALLSNFYRSSFPDLFLQLCGADGLLLAQGGSNKQKSVFPVFMDFKKTYNLVAGDEMVVNINTNGFNGATTGSDSYIELYGIDNSAIDSEQGTVKVHYIQAGKGSDEVIFPNGVTQIMLQNFDKSTILEADSPWSQVALTSAEHNIEQLTNNGLLAMRMTQFETPADSIARNQNHMIYDGAPLTKAKLQLTLTGGNVNASCCYVVYRCLAKTGETINRGIVHATAKQVDTLTAAGLHAHAAAVATNLQKKIASL